MHGFVRRLPISLLLVAYGCSTDPADTTTEGSGGKEDGPASYGGFIEEHDDRADEIWAFSDPHGGIDAMKRLLESSELIDSESTWSAGPVTMVIAGDLIDKGAHSLEVIDLLRRLEPQAAAAGGRLIVLLGNHEAEFFADPSNDKARTGIDNELGREGINPEELAAGMDSQGRGAWLASRPLGVRVKKYFFSHGGNTDKRSVKELRRLYATAFSTGKGFADKDVIGGNSILEAQGWYGDHRSDKAGRENARALGVDHIVFGHDPGAFGKKDQVEISNNGILIKLDCAMGLGGVEGELLHISTNGTDHAEKVRLDGSTEKLY